MKPKTFIKNLVATVPAVRTSCAWRKDDVGSVWWAGCGLARMADQQPSDMAWFFCPYCGAPIVETVWTGPDETVSERTTR